METTTLEGRRYSPKQKWLLLLALVIGLVWDYGWRQESFGVYGLFWGVYLAIFYALNWGVLKRNRLCWMLAAAAAALCLRLAWVLPEELYPLEIAALPAILITHMVFATVDIPKKQEGAVVALALRGIFVKPFTAVPDAFRAFAALFEKGGEGRFKRVLLGLAIGLPLAVVVLLLLSSADDMMSRMLGGWLNTRRIGPLIGHVLNTLVAALLFYSFLFNSRWGKTDTVAAREKKQAPQATAIVVLLLLLIVYAVFAYVQFKYLFGGRLPMDLSYSTYARKGFSELIVVALINFSAYTAINALCREGGVLRVLQTLLLAASALLIASAMQRLLLYMGAYGLTMMRILPLWLMIYLAALDVLAVVRVWRREMPMLRIAAIVLIWWFVLLSLLPWTRIISLVNLRYF